jgi:hypothetical protein
VPDFLNDQFIGTDGTFLQSHSPVIGGTWNGGNNAMQLLGNALTMPAGGGYELYANTASPGTADYTVEFQLTVQTSGVGNGLGVVGRGNASSPSNGYYWSFYPNANVWRLYKCCWGLLAQVSDTFGSGVIKTGKLVMAGNHIQGFVNGQLYADVMDWDYTSGVAGVWGEYGTPGAITMTNLRAYTLPQSPFNIGKSG